MRDDEFALPNIKKNFNCKYLFVNYLVHSKMVREYSKIFATYL